MNNNTKKLIGMLVSLAFLIAAFVFYFDFALPAYGDMQTLKGKEASEQNFLSQESNTVQKVQKLIAGYQNQSQAQNAVALSLPLKQDISGALTQIYGIAAVNSVNVQGINITLNSVLPSVGNSTAITDASSSQFINPIKSISFVITGSGSYEGFKGLISEIETNARLFDIRGASIQSIAQNGSNTKDIFSFTLTIAAYYQTI